MWNPRLSILLLFSISISQILLCVCIFCTALNFQVVCHFKNDCNVLKEFRLQYVDTVHFIEHITEHLY